MFTVIIAKKISHKVGYHHNFSLDIMTILNREKGFLK